MSLARDNAIKVLSNHENQWLLHALNGSRAEQVLAFHELYQQPIAVDCDSNISHMEDERICMRLGLILEEVKELLEDGFGVTAEINFSTHEGTKFHADNLLSAIKDTGARNVVGVCDALGDLSYVIDGFAVELGIELDDVIDEIHASNMTKPDENGDPIYRADGKVLKGPFFTEPNIESVIFKKES